MLGPIRVVALLCATCAHANEQVLQEVKDRALKALAGKVLRVTYTTIENPYIFQEDLPGGKRWAGVLVDFLTELSKEASFTTVEVKVSNDSFDLVKSSNTACARDVWKNRTDLCVGNSWVTTQRLGYAKVLPTLWQETLQLVVQRTANTSFLDALLQAFMPFHTWLWLSIALVVACYSAFAWYVEYRDNDRDFPIKDKWVAGLTSLYHGLFGFFWSEPPTRPVTAEGRVLAVGFGFFTLIMLSSYTASLASVLVSNTEVPEFQDLQDAITNQAGVCMWGSVLSRAEKLYPGITPLKRNMGSSYADGYDNMAEGNCQVLLADSIFHAKAQERSERDCNKVLVGGAVVDINCAWPAVDWLVGPLSYFMTQLMEQGVLDDLRRVYTPRILCPDTTYTEPFGVKNVSGVFFISLGFIVAAGIVHSCRRTVRYGKTTAVFQRMSSSGEKRTSAADAPKLNSPRDHTSVLSAEHGHHSRKSNHSGVTGLHEEDPGYAMVQAFRAERLLQEMPFEKALLTIGEAHAKGRDELLRMLQRPTMSSV